MDHNTPSFARWMRRRNIALGLVAATFLGLHHVGDWMGAGQTFPYVLEAVVLAVLGWALWAHPEVRRTLVGGAPQLRVYQRVIALVLALFVVGHLVKQNHLTFPLVAWTMYGNVEESDAPCQSYEAELMSGRRVAFNPAHVVPTLANSRIEHLLRRQIESVRASDVGVVRDQQMDVHHRTLNALARVYDRRWPGDPIKKITVSWCEVPLHGFKGQKSIRKERLWEIEVPSRG